MNNYLKTFIHRGLVFGGFGPIVGGIVFMTLSLSTNDFFVSGVQIFTMIISTYFLAFVQAGASVFNQIEHWSLPKSLLFHFASLYISYSLCYILNSWIPFEPLALIIFTIAFVALYMVIWIIVFITTKYTERKFNAKLN